MVRTLPMGARQRLHSSTSHSLLLLPMARATGSGDAAAAAAAAADDVPPCTAKSVLTRVAAGSMQEGGRRMQALLVRAQAGGGTQSLQVANGVVQASGAHIHREARMVQ